MRETVRKILDLLTPREKKTGLLVLAMVLVMALIETAGVASVMPFLAVLGNPEVVETNPYLSRAYERGGFESTQAFLTALGVASFLIVVCGAVFRLATYYALHRWANMRRHSVSQRLLAGYLRQPYEFFLARNTADLSKSILSEVEELTKNVFQPGIQLIAYATSALILVAFLVVVDPWIALGVAVVVGGSYALIYIAVRGVLGRIGRDRAEANRERFTAASEVLGGIKDIKVLGREDAYLSRFAGPSQRFSRHQATNAVVSLVPKHLIEAVGFGGILALAIVLMITRADLAATLPILGLYAFAGYRLLPSAQQVFAALSKLRFGWGAVEVVHAELGQAPRPGPEPSGAEPRLGSKMRIREAIELKEVSYVYPGSDRPALSGIDLVIPVGSSLGIVGRTGAGKTTLLDLILGLLVPTEGELLIDGISLDGSSVRQWQRCIGYVPQHIYLTDASIAENIALGVHPSEMDLDRVRSAAAVAQIHEFVETLERGFETVVGERGVRLSGGQRQRVGIARALYHDPEVLILDEATSALDTQTERLVRDAVATMRKEKTMVVVAHRLTTVETCDRILVLEAGKMGGVGTYGQFRNSKTVFQARVVGSS